MGRKGCMGNPAIQDFSASIYSGQGCSHGGWRGSGREGRLWEGPSLGMRSAGQDQASPPRPTPNLPVSLPPPCPMSLQFSSVGHSVVRLLLHPASWVTTQDEFSDLIIDEDEEAVGDCAEPPCDPVGAEVRAGSEQGRIGQDRAGQCQQTLT